MFDVLSDEACKIKEILDKGTIEEIKQLLALEENPETPEKIRGLIAATRKLCEKTSTSANTGRRISPKPTLDQLDKMQK